MPINCLAHVQCSRAAKGITNSEAVAAIVAALSVIIGIPSGIDWRVASFSMQLLEYLVVRSTRPATKEELDD